MPVFYLYALAADLGDLSDLRGVQGERLIAVPVGASVAVGGEVEERPALQAAMLEAQDALVRALHARAAALLPMQFGTSAESVDDVQRAIGAREGLAERLAAVRGCEQMIVRVFGVQPTAAEPRSNVNVTGRQYLEARAARRHPAPELSALAASVSTLQRDVRVEPAQQPGLLGSVYHLIERGRAAEYRAAIERAAGEHGVRVVVTGPSPPYAFA